MVSMKASAATNGSAGAPGRRRRALALGLVAVAAALLFRSLATTALDEDGPGLVRDVVLHPDALLSYYHVAYTAIGRILTHFLDGRALSALLWTSAGAAGLSVAFYARAAIHVGGAARGVVTTLALVASAGFWIQATRVEVHAMQACGAAALLLAATRHVGTARVRGALGLALAAAFALPCHSSNLLLFPGVWWIAARRGDRELRVPVRNGLLAALALGVGGAVGWWINSLSTMSGDSGPTGNVRYLVEHYFTGFSLSHVVDELLVPWGAALFVIAVLLTRTLLARDARSAARRLLPILPFIAAALPGLAFFTIYGVPTSGGYFVSPVLFVLAAAAAAHAAPSETNAAASPASRVVRPSVTAAFAVALGLGLVAGGIGVHTALTDPVRLSNARIGDARMAAVRALAPKGGILLGVHIDGQLINGRDPRWSHSEVAEVLTKPLLAGVPPERFARRFARLGSQIRASGTTLVIDRGWKELAVLHPPFGPYMEAIEAAIGEHYLLEPREWNGQPYLVGTPRQIEERKGARSDDR